MKEITNLVRSGTPYHVIMDMVASKIVSEALVMSRGSQREAALLLGINRATIRKYSGVAQVNREKSDTPVKLEPIPRGWRRGLGFAPKTRGRVEAELTDGTVVIGKPSDLDWSLIVKWRRYK